MENDDELLALAKKEFSKCKRNPVYFVETYLVDDGHPIKLTNKQKELIRGWSGKKKKITKEDEHHIEIKKFLRRVAWKKFTSQPDYVDGTIYFRFIVGDDLKISVNMNDAYDDNWREIANCVQLNEDIDRILLRAINRSNSVDITIMSEMIFKENISEVWQIENLPQYAKLISKLRYIRKHLLKLPNRLYRNDNLFGEEFVYFNEPYTVNLFCSVIDWEKLQINYNTENPKEVWSDKDY